MDTVPPDPMATLFVLGAANTDDSAYRIADGAELHFSPGIRQVDGLPLVFERDRVTA